MLKTILRCQVSNKIIAAACFTIATLTTVETFAQGKPKPPVPPVKVNGDGKLVYTADSLGNRVPDFSYCGYMSGEQPIPDVPVRVVVPVKAGDATLRIQAAIDYVASLPAGKDGIRGAVLLEKGTYEVNGTLEINHSGVILRGCGMGESGTVLLATGLDRATFIRVFDKNKEARLAQIGIENLTCQSTYDRSNPKDEAHRWMAITMEHVQDAWVRQVIFRHFAGSAVCVLETASRITVEDCKSLAPVSEIGGQRRYTFYTSGRQVLFQRIYAEHGYHDFAVGYTPEGPNAFVQCESHLPYSYSGTIENTASKVLFDVVKVDGNALGFPFTGFSGRGRGEGVTNSVLWQSTAARVDCYQQPGASNWGFGIWAEFAGNGTWFYSNEHIQPRSLYYAQLKDRIGASAMERAHLLSIGTEPSTSPTIAKAAELTAEARNPLVELSQWIDQAPQRHAIPVDAGGVKTIDQIGYNQPATPKTFPATAIANGWLVKGSSILTGNRHQVSWWRGNLSPKAVSEATPHITRYVPGRTGAGFTDDLNEVTDWMVSKHILAIDHNYGLWYDRRRDDHERIRRMDGNVRPPFYELPFARSGQGTAWDGLSKYDLTKYNHWYWKRLKDFAQLADEKGLVLIHQNYFQHNILEAGAHYADFPWRTANNINNTPFAEPPPYAGDKRIFLAEQFYDTSNAAYRALHRAYIRQCLDNFSDNTSVIQLISAEYTGPLHFVQFWLNVIKEWEREKGKKAIIGLSTTKDVQDAILANKELAPVVDLIDIRYWYYQSDGQPYAPEGGKNLAPRQHARQMKSKGTSFDMVYKAVREYRENNPGKAVIYSSEGFDRFGWASFMAGGSMSAIPAMNPEFLKEASQMQPLTLNDHQKGLWVLANPGKGYILYADSSAPVQLDLTAHKGNFRLTWIDPQNGQPLNKGEKMKGGKVLTLNSPLKRAVVAWVSSTK